MEDKRVQSGGITFTGLLTCIFIALKLMNTINWSWWWVLSPLWIPIVASFIIIIVASLIIGLIELIFGEDD